jgi:hypothetical protein
MTNNAVSRRSLKIGMNKKKFTSRKAHTFSDTRILNVHGNKSHCGSVMCVTTGVVSKYFLFLCLLNALFQITQVSNASRKSLISAWLNIAIPSSVLTTCQVRKCIAFSEYVQCLLKDLEACIHVHHWLATNHFNYSVGFMNRLW